jgi:hypothetical protein
MIKLGEEVRCKVTGFKGIATARIEYLNGCIQYGVKPKVKTGEKYPDTIYIDQEQLELTKKRISVKKNRTGGPELIKNESGLK